MTPTRGANVAFSFVLVGNPHVFAADERDTHNLCAFETLVSASITMREFIRAFGKRVNVEFIREKIRKVVGSVWFLFELSPVRYPTGGANIMQV